MDHQAQHHHHHHPQQGGHVVQHHRQINNSNMSSGGHFQSGPPHMQSNTSHHHPPQQSLPQQLPHQRRAPGGTSMLGGGSRHHMPLGGAGDAHPHHRPPINALGPIAASGQAAQVKDMPLRMVVDAKYVGAIIGQGGANIREITKESKARCVVDVQRAMRDSAGNLEKVISILGQPDNCSKACMKVLEVIRREAEKDPAANFNANDFELKLRAHNQLVGRLIGKGGSTIKKIMEETGSTVFVSNEPSSPTRAEAMGALPPFVGIYADMSQLPPMERTITIRAPSMAILSQAEQRISSKLRLSYETDLANRSLYPHAMAGSAMAAALGGTLLPFGGASGGDPYGMGGGGMMGVGRQSLSAAHPPTKVVHMWVPNNMVGALIGSKGVHIRQVMRVTGAHIRIEGGATASHAQFTTKPERTSNTTTSSTEAPNGKGAADVGEMITDDNDNEDTKTTPSQAPNGTVDKVETGTSPTASGGGGSPSPSAMAQQTHGSSTSTANAGGSGSPHSDERLVTITGTDPQQYKAQFWIYQRVAEQGYHFLEEVRLCTEISVPSKLVGRIIGKGGQNVRELQRLTGAQVKIPEEAEAGGGGGGEHDETVVRIAGNFQASQAVQCRIAHMVQQYQQHNSMGSTGGGGTTPSMGVGASSMRA